ncbi:outer membrane beta-barrel protein [Marinigracilibium pacificum]|uniref:Porin family protein n=1 Tax=Marinigracilibium pacificum TaxID=2729599 RepID=A0A848IUK5_9BACT|nr:outer membrane beta-barrel protein [Marinigracilibium pacificum]NMM48017.1 porin family protein [Marinigracilibium pacificum]
MRLKRVLLFIIFISFVGIEMDAQSFYGLRRDRPWQLSVGGGVSTYYGDMKEGRWMDDNLNISVGGMYKINNHLSLRSELTYFRLSGNDLDSKNETSIRQRYLHFRADNFELNFQALVYFFNNGISYYMRPTFNLYAFGGVGAFYSNPKSEIDGTWYALRPVKTEGNSYSPIHGNFNGGFGVTVKLSYNLSLMAEAGWRITTTDYIDDVSTTYIDQSNFADPIDKLLADRRPAFGQTAWEEGHIRGNPNENDGYMFAQVKLQIYLDKGKNRAKTQRGNYKNRTNYPGSYGGRKRNRR